MIAEFMGEFNVHEVEGRFVCNNCGHEYSAMLSDDEIPMIHAECMPDIVTLAQYHTSWDWLMPVVEKIESLGFNVEKNFQPIDKDFQCLITKGNDILFQEFNEYSITAMHYVVVDFIEFYNKQES